MGTLTADAVRLDEYCEHKLPSSCRLTATPECCACQDKRNHAPTYSTYVDGVGMVSRGTRWQRYCWFCKEFWENRVALASMDPKVTRVPEEPNQTEFCIRWHEYQKGVRRRTRAEDGSEYTEWLTCEVPWRDTPPGYLPLRRQPDSPSRPIPAAPAAPSQPHVSIEEALEAMMDDDEAGSNESRPPHARDSGIPVRETVEQRNTLPSEDQIREAQVRLNEALERKRRIAEELSSAETDLRVCREQHRQISTAQQRMRNFERVFGTREDVRRQGDAYESPLSAMFQRAYRWHQTAEEVRAAERDSNRQEEDYTRLLSSIEEPWLRRTLYSVRAQVEEELDTSSQRPQSLDDDRIPRPRPKSDAEMYDCLITGCTANMLTSFRTVSLSCRIWYVSQAASGLSKG